MTPTSAEHRSLPRLSGRARRTAVAAAVATALGVFLAPNAMSQTASQSDVQNLQQEIDKLQRELEKMKTQPVPAPTAAQEPSHSAAEAAKTAPVFYAGPVKVTLGGFVELMVIDRNRNESADWASNFNGSIPYPNSHEYNISEFHLTERQSRISALVDGPDAGVDRALERRRRAQRQPQAGLRGERLLRREVVDVGLRRRRRRPPPAADVRVDEHQGVVGAGDPLHRQHHAGRGLVVRPGVGVDAGARRSSTRRAAVLGRARTTARPGTARRAVTAANLAENSPHTSVLRRARGSGRTRRRPRTRSTRRCRARPRSRRAARTARAARPGCARRAALTGAWRWLVPEQRAPVSPRARTAAAGPSTGPEPNRPSRRSCSASRDLDRRAREPPIQPSTVSR